MAVRLEIPSAIGESLLTHLGAAAEQVAFLLGTGGSDGHIYTLDELFRVSEDGLDYRSFHVSLTDRARQAVLAWASRRGDILVEAHSHGQFGDPAAFSLLDLEGLAEWVPHVRWRLDGRPYAALVFGQKTVDGLAWLHDDSPARVNQLEVVDGPSYTTTGRSYRRLSRGPDA